MRGNELPPGRQVATWGRSLGGPSGVLELAYGSFLISVKQNVGFEVREPGMFIPALSTRCAAVGGPCTSHPRFLFVMGG